jgi:hypothetical protein
MHSRPIHRFVVLTLAFSVSSGALHAQHGGGAAARPASVAPKEAEQFAFLIGQWDLTVIPKASGLGQRIHGAPKLLGTWKAWRAVDGFGIEDELRIIDASGNPSALAHTMRIFDAAQGKWTQSTLDVYRGRFTNATGTFANGVLTLRSVGRDAEGKPYVQRVRFSDITPGGFRYQADRSSDGERSWEEGVLRIEAKRVAASAPR